MIDGVVDETSLFAFPTITRSQKILDLLFIGDQHGGAEGR